MKYPLKLKFNLFSLAQQIEVSDADGQPILYVKQKMFRFKERVEVFSDRSLKNMLFVINADRVIDFSANYSFTSVDGQPWGAVRRRGLKSLWSAHYEIMQDNQVEMTLREDSPWKKVIESILGDIPLIGFIFLYLLNPSYTIARADGTAVLRVVKKPSIFERFFVIEKLSDIQPDDELRALLSLLMMVLLEKKRG